QLHDRGLINGVWPAARTRRRARSGCDLRHDILLVSAGQPCRLACHPSPEGGGWAVATLGPVTGARRERNLRGAARLLLLPELVGGAAACLVSRRQLGREPAAVAGAVGRRHPARTGAAGDDPCAAGELSRRRSPGKGATLMSCCGKHRA